MIPHEQVTSARSGITLPGVSTIADAALGPPAVTSRFTRRRGSACDRSESHEVPSNASLASNRSKISGMSTSPGAASKPKIIRRPMMAMSSHGTVLVISKGSRSWRGDDISRIVGVTRGVAGTGIEAVSRDGRTCRARAPAAAAATVSTSAAPARPRAMPGCICACMKRLLLRARGPGWFDRVSPARAEEVRLSRMPGRGGVSVDCISRPRVSIARSVSPGACCPSLPTSFPAPPTSRSRMWLLRNCCIVPRMGKFDRCSGCTGTTYSPAMF